MKIHQIFFTELKTDFIEIYKNLEITKNKMKNIPRLIIPYRSLLSSFMPFYDEKLYTEKEKYIEEFKESLEVFKKEINKTKDSDLKRAIYFALKSYKEYLIEKYLDIIKNKRQYSDQLINNLIDFNNSIFEMFNNFKKMIESEINIKIGNNNDKRCNEFRRCYKCGLTLFQVVTMASSLNFIFLKIVLFINVHFAL